MGFEHRPLLADFDPVLKDPRITRLAAAYSTGFLLSFAFPLFGMITLGAGTLFGADGWFDATGAKVAVFVAVLALLSALVGIVLLGMHARLVGKAERFVQQVFAEDAYFAYGARVPVERMPVEVGEVASFMAEIDGQDRPVSVVLPTENQPLVLIPTRELRPLIALSEARS